MPSSQPLEDPAVTTTDIPPLQTHGIYDETWVPPKTRWITYEKRDEQWARYCGIGEIVRSLVPLYDVRDEEGKLLGYTRHRPDYNGFELTLRKAHPRSRIWFGYREIKPPDTRCIEVFVQRYGLCGQNFLCWKAQLSDAPDLIECRWIEVIGEDCIQEALELAERRLYDRYGRSR